MIGVRSHRCNDSATADVPGSAWHRRAVHADTRTARLRLRRPVEEDLEELYALYADPLVWQADPVSRHEAPADTAAMLARWQGAWDRDGLGMWVARDEAGLVGIGGCSVRLGVAWNLGFRLAPSRWGQGYAAELDAAAMSAARQVRPGLPVTAYLLEGNDRSRRATERTGLALVWRGRDAGNPDPDAVRLLYADAVLTSDVVGVLTTT